MASPKGRAQRANMGQTENLAEGVIASYQGSDGATLQYRYWQGVPGRPVIVHLHGIEGHSQWLEPTAKILASQGMTIYAPDRRGSGLNSRATGQPTHFQQFLSDIQEMLFLASKESGPLFLVGNCWGAKPAAVLISRWQQGKVQLPEIKGLILTSPALITKADLTFSEKLLVAYRWLTGSMVKIPVPLTAEMLTDNKPYLDYITNDPDRLTEVTAHFFAQTFFLTEIAKRQAHAIRLPLLVLQAGRDDIVNIDQINKWFAKAASADKTFKMFDWMAHSLDFDKKADEYVSVLTRWINEKAQAEV